MRRLLVMIASILSVSVCGSEARNPSIAESDFLIPVDGIIQSDYYALLRRKLFVTPSEFLRVVDLSAGANEAVVAIYTVRARGQEGVRITYTSPGKLLWDVGADSQNHFVKDPRVSIKRIDAPFPRPLALAVSAALRHLLQERRPPLKTEQVIVDGPLIEFSLPEGDQTIRGLLSPYMSDKKGKSLLSLTDLLQRYCLARADRPKIAEAIAHEAAKIMRYPIRKRPNQARGCVISLRAKKTTHEDDL